MEKADIIEKVVGPTPWVSPIVCVPKKQKDQVRICVDMREPNKAIGRERHPMPTLDDLIADLNGDLKKVGQNSTNRNVFSLQTVLLSLVMFLVKTAFQPTQTRSILS